MHVEIAGMHCGACATGIQMLISQIDGVGNVSVDYNKKMGDVEFDEGKVKKDDIFKAIADLGYTAKEGN